MHIYAPNDTTAHPSRVRRFLKCLDDGWGREHLDAHAQLVLRTAQDELRAGL